MKKIISLLSVLTFIGFTNVKAEMTYGIGLMTGQVSASGTETEGTAADTSDRSKSVKEFFLGADIFAETELANGMSVGLSYVPLDIEIGSGDRTDLNGNDPAENDDGRRKASADLSDLVTLYTNIPVGDSGGYALLGAHYTKVTPSTTLPNSTYGSENVFGAQLGFGMKQGKGKIELYYSDFPDIELTSSGGNSNKISADADAITLRLSLGF